MKLVNEDSLGSTLDAANEALFYGREIPADQKLELARWIAGRQGLPGSYAGMFAGTDADRASGYKVFSGESIKTGAGTAHILGEEASRLLIKLDVQDVEVQNALARATEGMMKCLLTETGEPKISCMGIYCCGICSVAYWRHLVVGGLQDSEARLAAGVEALKEHRIGNGRWQRFPFHYALLALSEIDLPSAIEEMRYAAPVCESYLMRKPKDGETAKRRRIVAEKVLAKC
jgi:hypothetical protein